MLGVDAVGGGGAGLQVETEGGGDGGGEACCNGEWLRWSLEMTEMLQLSDWRVWFRGIEISVCLSTALQLLEGDGGGVCPAEGVGGGDGVATRLRLLGRGTKMGADFCFFFGGMFVAKKPILSSSTQNLTVKPACLRAKSSRSHRSC